jgi:predicted metal-dependent hydrolase
MLKRVRDDFETPLEVKVRGLDSPVTIRKSARARRFSLQVSEARRDAVLTMPVYSSLSEAGDFLTRHYDWLKKRMDRLPEPVPFASGAVIPLRGVSHVIRFVGPAQRRGVVWAEPADNPSSPAMWPDGANVPPRRLPRLCVAGDRPHAPRRLADWLKREAQKDLKQRVAFHARRLRVAPARMFVRDQTTRWGSCSTSGSVNFSWRLVLAPPVVLDYLAAHEVAHLREMNHGPRFWRLVSETMPRAEEARSWLRLHGAGLHRFGAER